MLSLLRERLRNTILYNHDIVAVLLLAINAFSWGALVAIVIEFYVEHESYLQDKKNINVVILMTWALANHIWLFYRFYRLIKDIFTVRYLLFSLGLTLYAFLRGSLIHVYIQTGPTSIWVLFLRVILIASGLTIHIYLSYLFA